MFTTETEVEVLAKTPIEAPPKAIERNISYYKSALSADLTPELFKPNPGRLIWYAGCLIVAALCFYSIVALHLSWELKLLAGLVIGFCGGTLGFLVHEIVHGSVVRSPGLQYFLSFFGTMPFLLAPTYWKFSHNRLHHGKPQKLIEDPDAFPNLRIYKASRFVQFMFPFTPGSKHKRSVFYFFYWFTFNSLVAQLYLRFRNKIFDPMDHRRVNFELALQFTIVFALFVVAGPSNWLWALVIPFCVQNYMLMSYISTNHNLNSLTVDNDPLENTLSVSNFRILEFFNMNFGFHVEHHLFPTINGKNARAVHAALIKKFPDTYKIMPKWRAMKALYTTPRIYKNANQLINPETLEVFDTL